MAHAYYHAVSSARRFGGQTADYLAVHEFMDSTKAHVPDNRHRLFLHNAWGIFLVEAVLGKVLLRASDGGVVPMRTILERHVKEDYGGKIPRLDECFARPASHAFFATDDTWEHCERSSACFGGNPSEYVSIHAAMNQVRQVLPDQIGRCVLHNAWGIDLLVRTLGGEARQCSSDQQRYSVRQVLEEHVRSDLGIIPSLGESIEHIPLASWMYQEALPLSHVLSQTPE